MHWGLCAHAALASRSMLSWILGVSLYLVLPVTEQRNAHVYSHVRNLLCAEAQRSGVMQIEGNNLPTLLL